MIEKNIEESFKLIADSKNRKYLLAVSGGVDSMVLLHYFQKNNLSFEVAHINYQLRDEDSEKDQKLVEKTCEDYGVKLHLKKINTRELLLNSKDSLQMIARDERYSFFREIINQNNLDYLVTAHHLDDQIETFFINLSRGTGLEGLTGMKVLSNDIFRPMLGISKDDIYKYAKANNVAYREDLSNQKNDYDRNLIRNKIAPLFKELNPSFNKTMQHNMAALGQTNDWAKHKINNELSEGIIETKEEIISLNLDKVLKLKHPFVYLFHYLSSFGFNHNQVKQLIDLFDKENKVGKQFFSDEYVLNVDRQKLLLTPKKGIKTEVVEIKKIENNVTYPVKLSFDVLPKDEIEVEGDSNKAFIDIEKIELPLKLRRWSDGDTFQPLGMTGKKKVSDFLVDNKVPLVLKQNVFVLTSRDEIIWVVGYRVSEKFKITSSTSRVLLITKT